MVSIVLCHFIIMASPILHYIYEAYCMTLPFSVKVSDLSSVVVYIYTDPGKCVVLDVRYVTD